jgi:hypothetical protein
MMRTARSLLIPFSNHKRLAHLTCYIPVQFLGRHLPCILISAIATRDSSENRPPLPSKATLLVFDWMQSNFSSRTPAIR